jgi:RNA polymerase sigma-70 factor, ECF subfamily
VRPSLEAPEISPPPGPIGPTAEQRLAAMFDRYFHFVWRSLRRLGVADHAVDDATQEVFVVASRRLESIEMGKEKAFLFGTAMRVAADFRRASGRRAGLLVVTDPVPDAAGPDPALDELLDRKRARQMLDAIVADLADDTRPVFVLYELEGMTMAEIAACLGLPPGTVASRLRRAREEFAIALARIQSAREDHG